MIAHSKISTAARVIVVALLALGCQLNDVAVLGQNDPDKRVLLDLPSLPDPFTNDKLPTGGEAPPPTAKEKCFSMMGCYEELPITNIPQNPLTMRTEFRLFHGDAPETVLEFGRYENCLKSKPNECELYPFNLQALLESPFAPTRRTIVVIGGYMSKAPSSWETNLKDLWSQLDDVNVILLCWVGGNSGLYQTAAANTRPVARQLTVLLYYLAKLKASGDLELELSDDVYTEKLYMIGHSLGAHIAGFVGQDLAGRMGRITGLDPAGPSFDVLPRRFRVDRSDAQLVDIMHTNAGSKIFAAQTQYGSALASGHIDLWANDGAHQPGCSNDMLGCSHKRANKYYEAFLNHHLSMRNFVPSTSNPDKAGELLPYRLSAYAGDTYEDFHNGSSLIRRCPVTALDDQDLRAPDLDACLVPVDYVGWFDTVKQELATKHGVDFGPLTSASSTPLPHNYYFYTGAQADDQMDHYLVRIRISKAAYGGGGGGESASLGIGEKSALDKVNGLFQRGGCDVGFDIEMAGGLETSYKIKKYRLLDRLDHLELVFPYLSPNIMSKYEVAKLDAADYYVERKSGKDFVAPEDLAHLRESLNKIFPSLIGVRGFNNGEELPDGSSRKRKKKGGFFDSLVRLFSGSSASKKNSPDESLDHADCQLAIESFAVQPLRKFHRHLSAVFTRDCPKEPRRPMNIVILDQGEASPKSELLDEAACKTSPADTTGGEPKLALRTVIIGPHMALEGAASASSPGASAEDEPMLGAHSEEFTTEESQLDEQALQVANALPGGVPVARAESTGRHAGGANSGGGHLWLVLTLLLLVGLLILMLITMVVSLRRLGATSRTASKTTLVAMTNPNHQCAFSLTPSSAAASSIPEIKLTN